MDYHYRLFGILKRSNLAHVSIYNVDKQSAAKLYKIAYVIRWQVLKLDRTNWLSTNIGYNGDLVSHVPFFPWLWFNSGNIALCVSGLKCRP